MKVFKYILIAILSLAVFNNTALAYYDPGIPTGFVNDYTNTFSGEQKISLENKLSAYEKETSNEITIVFIPNLQDDSIENFAVELFQNWGIGKKGVDNGVLILVALEDRKMRIEVGYGLEGALTDAQSFWIVDQIMKPAFRENDFYKGIDESIDKVISATQGEVLPSQTEDKSEFAIQDIIWFIAFIFLWISGILARSKSWWLGGVFGGVAGLIIGFVYFSFMTGFLSCVLLVPLGLLFDFFISKHYTKSKNLGHVPWYIGGGRGGTGSGGGFGGFGGGMSGGGGSSGSW